MKKYIFLILLILPAFIHGMNSDKAAAIQWNEFVAKTKNCLSQDKDYFTGITSYRISHPLKNYKKKPHSKSTVKKENFGVYLRGEAKLKLVTRKVAPIEAILTRSNSHKQTLIFN